MGCSWTGIISIALTLLRKAIDMKVAVTVHRSNKPLPVKPGEKNICCSDLFFFFFVNHLGKGSALRVPNGKRKMRTLSSVPTP